MRKILFSSHAEEKFRILRSHGFFVSRDEVVGTLRKPDKVGRGLENRWIAQKAIWKEYVLRVVYEKRGPSILVITFYPGRRSYYES